MSYQTLVKKQVRNAFNLAGDLVKNVILTKKTSTGFDFSDLTADLTAPQVLSVKCIVNEYKKSSRDKQIDETNINKLSLIFISEDISSFSDFDIITIDGITYTPERPFKNNGYSYEITAVRNL